MCIRDSFYTPATVVRYMVEVLDPQQGFSVVGSETHDFLYEQVGERWIFTTFSMVR